ncbi:MAG: FeoB-associated Cys-rich membrane protein [Lachnospiraceae bacterium]|nr:FeoB-associated Cys-rich membrane protein [Lachnospiraceae bacterium]MCI7596022.1 FeoB-associated Cys-rich membrane protein [Lachnospiraceae bacterium]MDD7049503.1 FeoB-associated Cys-rich membrane protein [Lachnospiraceae bacterium]MDY3223468.1 FeoB-associated Cys-rich membrane protein [Lachnospiraceae bacterium]MDY4096250.1 FeoB-associated Cys-rich membrane protein [Lachnospiraceae bacterium]
MANFIVGGIVLILIGAATAYIVKSRKSGVKCIGCPSGCGCSTHNGADGCDCHSRE